MGRQFSIEAVRDRAQAFRELHAGPAMLVLPNAWDAASAQAFELAGFPAIATTSGGVAAALGFEDHEGAPVSEMAAAAARITAAVDIPVTVDFEAGYNLSAGEVVGRLIDIGAAGFNIEDSDHGSGASSPPAARPNESLLSRRLRTRPVSRWSLTPASMSSSVDRAAPKNN